MAGQRPCAYCGRRAKTTQDHVPPKSLFSKPLPVAMITVPACPRCHSEKTALDDEYFRLMVSPSEQAGEQRNAKAAFEVAVRALLKPEATRSRARFVSSLGNVWVPSPSGLLTKRLAYRVDFKRLSRVVERCARGLYYRKYSEPLPSSHDVRVLCDDILADFPREYVDELVRTVVKPLAAMPAKVIQEGTFWFRESAVEENGVRLTVWALTFYAGITFLALTGPRQPSA